MLIGVSEGGGFFVLISCIWFVGERRREGMGEEGAIVLLWNCEGLMHSV